MRQEHRHDAWAGLRNEIAQNLAANLSGPIFEGHRCSCGAEATHRRWECSHSQLCVSVAVEKTLQNSSSYLIKMLCISKGIFCEMCSMAHSRSVFGHSLEIGDYVQKPTGTQKEVICCVRAYHISGAYDMTLNVTEPAAAGLVKYRLFPSSPKSPKVVLSIDLLRCARFLVLSADLSMAKALDASAFFW